MLTPETETTREPSSTSQSGANRGMGAAARDVSEHASALVRLEIELATLELKRKLAALGLGIGLALGASVVLLYMLGFALSTLAAVFDTFLARWLSLLIVTVLLLAIGALLAVLALKSLRRGTPPVPEQAIEEAKRTSEALKRNGPAN